MKPAKFVLAVPRERAKISQPHLATTHRLSGVCASGPRLWMDDGVPSIDLGTAGRIVGVVFSRVSAARHDSLPDEATIGRGVAYIATWLVRECWGAYFAFLADPATGAFQVLVDPSGLLPVYRIQTTTHVLFTTHPASLREACGWAPQVCWQALGSHLARPELRQRSTCLAGVTELPPGTLVPIDGPETRLWRPDDFMPPDRDFSFEDVADELGETAVRVMGAWAQCLGPVAVAASGGVDSSFICAALARGGCSFSCVTLATADPSGDERPFAGMLAEHFGVPCNSAIYDAGRMDPMSCASAGLPRPARRSFLTAVDSGLAAAARGLGTSAIFDGNGGDNLFCFLHSAAPVVDRLLCEGPRRRVLATFLDMCEVTGCDAQTMLRAAVRRMLRRRPAALWSANLRLLAIEPEVADSVDPLTPWIDASVGRHRSKRDHLTLIMRNQNFVHGLGAAGLPRFSPLMSQPLIEFCLGVPSWIWCQGGINRALARAAFASDLPRDIVARTSKSGPDSFICRTFDRNRPSIRKLLLDGLVARHGLIDLAAVEVALSVDAFSGDPNVYRLLDLAEAENWARSWIE